jgi:hypothetical protein
MAEDVHKVQPDEVFAFVLDALKSGLSADYIVIEVGAAVRFYHELPSHLGPEILIQNIEATCG